MLLVRTPEHIRELLTAQLNAGVDWSQFAGILPNATPAGLFELAEELDAAGEAAAARSAYAHLINDPAADADVVLRARLALGVLLSRLGLAAEAESALAKLEFAADGPVRDQGWYHRACVLMSLRRFEEAYRLLDGLAARSPQWRADKHLRLRRLASALSANPDAGSMAELMAEWNGAGRPENALDVRLWMELAFDLEVSGQLEGALTLYRGIADLEDVPADVRQNLHYRTGLVLEAQHDFERAAEQYAIAIALPRTFPAAQAEARWRMARLRFLNEEHAAAETDLLLCEKDEALHVETRQEAAFCLGLCCDRMGRMPEAIAWMTRAREEQVCSPQFRIRVDLALADLHERAGALPAAREALNRVSNDPEADQLTRLAAYNALLRLRRR
jgi:tetratricopeptide (TPR) repeat protein